MNRAYFLNTVWAWRCMPEARRFRAATHCAAATQADVLAKIIRANRDTAFGRRHQFASIRDPRDYQQRVPLARYEDFQTDIEQIAAGEPSVLTADRVLLLQPTSGTTGGEKLIPYTASLRREYQRGVATWIANLFSARSAVRSGRAYWSISPAAATARITPGGIAIGFENDEAYLGRWEQCMVRQLLAVSGDVARLPSIDDFRYATLLQLLAADDLALISVWNPTFLLALLDGLDTWSDRLAWDLERGTISMPTDAEAVLPGSLKPNRRRAEEVRSLFRGYQDRAAALRASWPQLALISCWTDAAAARHADELRQVFPQVEIQPKGLLATEGFVSLPLVDRPGAALALRSHFLEFQPCDRADATAPCRLAHELEIQGHYRVVLTTGGGLYRYQLGDAIEVVGFENQCPLIRFLGKADRVSDLVGEKLAEAHVRRALDELFTECRTQPRFALLAPCDETPRHYRLFLQFADRAGEALNLASFRDRLERSLCENPHYQYAVRLGQLAPVAVTLLDPHAEPAARIFERQCLARGQSLGNIKPTVLDCWTGWAAAFDHAVQLAALSRRS